MRMVKIELRHTFPNWPILRNANDWHIQIVKIAFSAIPQLENRRNAVKKFWHSFLTLARKMKLLVFSFARIGNVNIDT